jgi:prepilin-type N-terminal cleavage/methylation domain-containing protein
MTNQRGFTLIEVVIVIAIFAFLMVSLMGLMMWHNKVFMMERAEIAATGSARNVMNNVTKYTAQAYQVAASTVVSGTTYTTDADTVVLQLPTYNASGAIVNATYDYVIFNLSGTNLYQIISIGAGSNRKAGTKLLSDSIYTVSFTYDNPTVTSATKVTIDLTTRSLIRGDQYASANFDNTIFLRNK